MLCSFSPKDGPEFGEGEGEMCTDVEKESPNGTIVADVVLGREIVRVMYVVEDGEITFMSGGS